MVPHWGFSRARSEIGKILSQIYCFKRKKFSSDLLGKFPMIAVGRFTSQMARTGWVGAKSQGPSFFASVRALDPDCHAPRSDALPAPSESPAFSTRGLVPPVYTSSGSLGVRTLHD